MMRKEFTVQSNYDGLALKGLVFEPETSPKGIVQIVHGMCEHKHRYEDVLSFLAENGYIAACYDQRGHGDSVEKEEDRGWFRDTKSKAIVEDAVQITAYLRSQYPNLPLTLFGHSMGSMVVRCYLRENDDKIDKLIVCGSPCNNPLAGTAVLLAKTIRLFRGERHRSKFLAYMSTGKGNAEFVKAGKGSWLTHDEEIASVFRNDAKCRFHFTANGFENLFNLMKFTYQKRGYQVKNPTLPIHFISGTEDAVLGSEKKWKSALAILEKLGYKQVTGKLYEGMRHEVHNELGREEVYKDILAFIEE